MHAPHLSLLLLRLLVVTLVGLLLTQCAHRDEAAATAAASKAEWYIASKEPLTYCPKGHPFPSDEAEGASFVYLADRRTRFHIPRHGGALHQQQALKMRQASLSASRKWFSSTEATASWVSQTLLRLSLSASAVAVILPAGLVGGVPVTPSTFKTIWSD
ncbi:MAG: hypothetical protein Q8M07_14400 [Prosthecobacter sp.]|nr:hypothetical protein [Prosthecobacter sp.]